MKKQSVKKKAMIEALEKSLGVVTTACKMVGIDRWNHYEWLAKDPAYREAVEAVKDVALDFAESSLLKQIKEGNPTSTIFYLKTQGKKRGYVERSEVEHSGKIEMPDWLK